MTSEAESQIKKLGLIVIDRDKYWEIVFSFLSLKTRQNYPSFQDWVESDNSIKFSYFVDHKLGIRIIRHTVDNNELLKGIGWNDFLFEIKDHKKYLWASFKYDI